MILVLRAASMSGLPFYIAEEKGFFDRENVKVRCIHSHDPKRRIVQLLVEGEVAFYTSISAIVEAVTQGVKVKALCATSTSYPDKDDAWPEGCLATSQALIEEKPEVIQKVVNAVVTATEYARSHKEEALAVAMNHVGYLGKEAVEGNYEVLREWYSNDISETAIAHIVEVLELKNEPVKQLRLEDFADLSFLMQTRQGLRR